MQRALAAETFTSCRVRAACPARACDIVPLGLCCAFERRVFSLRMHRHQPVQSALAKASCANAAELLAHYDLLVESFAAHVYADATDPLTHPRCFDAHGDGVVSAAGRVAFLRAIGLVRTSSHGESSGNGENIGGAGAFRFHRQWSVQTSSISSAKAALVLAAQVRSARVSE